jgi:hypothetical protein
VASFAKQTRFEPTTGFAPFVLQDDLLDATGTGINDSSRPHRSISLSAHAIEYFLHDYMAAFYVAQQDFGNWRHPPNRVLDRYELESVAAGTAARVHCEF